MSSPVVYFTSISPTSQYNLWVTDGTAAGTFQIPAPSGVAGLDPTGYATLNGSVYFKGADTAGKFNLFKVGGTNAVTELAVSGAYNTGLDPAGTVAWSGKLYFQGANASNETTLWSSDGTAAGTVPFPNFGISGGYYPSSLTPFGSKLAFSASPSNFAQGGVDLTDGTASGTTLVPISAAVSFGNDNTVAAIGGLLVFGGLSTSFRDGLFVSDGTGPGTKQLVVPTLNPNGGSSGRVADLIAFGSKAGFTGVDASGANGIWVTDGTSAGTVELPGVYGNSYGSPMAALAGNRLAFIAQNGSGDAAVYVTDGTAAGTTRLAVPGAAASLAPHAVFTAGDRLYFDGVTSTGARGLFVSDGTAAGTSLVTTGVNLVAGNIGSDTGALGGTVAYTDTTAGTSGIARADIYTGPVSYLQQQYIWSGTDGVAMAADAPGTFLHGGAGDDALSVNAGSNVLDGGTGSNFLTGATGADGGADTFFVDGRGGGSVTWSTLNTFHHGDAATLWGFVGGTSTGFNAATGQGAFTFDGVQGYQGATLHSELGGAGTGVNASLTIAGMSVADAASKLTLTTGSVGGNAYLHVAYTGA